MPGGVRDENAIQEGCFRLSVKTALDGLAGHMPSESILCMHCPGAFVPKTPPIPSVGRCRLSAALARPEPVAFAIERNANGG